MLQLFHKLKEEWDDFWWMPFELKMFFISGCVFIIVVIVLAYLNRR